ncbi:MAG: ATP-dependent protease [Candidatus Rokuibacteriota bacterium]|nr:MAG: ATP-dependent protease [Candidatus Rokubacteria bacterium]PYO04983.1 MAG: ATP-dependent protease [Candidatus Rokubacteria bacterium]
MRRRPGRSATWPRPCSGVSTSWPRRGRCRRSADRGPRSRAVPPLTLPIFPLPDVTFFPNTLLPLHVFEARYRAMVMDVLARDRRLAVVKLKPGFDEVTYLGKPAVHAVAGAGEIVSWERLATGRYNILVKGEWRVRIEAERPSDTLYRIVTAQKLEDIAPTTDVSAALTRIRGACGRLLVALDRPPDLLDTALAEGQAPAVIADRVAAAVVPDPALRQELLETLDVTGRLERLGAALDQLVNELRRGRE